MVSAAFDLIRLIVEVGGLITLGIMVLALTCHGIAWAWSILHGTLPFEVKRWFRRTDAH